MGRASADFLAQEDAADLAPFDPDSPLVRRFHQGVESAVGFGFGVGGDQRPIPLANNRARGKSLGQGDDLAPLGFA